MIYIMKVLIGIAIFWFICGIVSVLFGGYNYHKYRTGLVNKKPRPIQDLYENLWLIPLGPIGLVAVIIVYFDDKRKLTYNDDP